MPAGPQGRSNSREGLQPRDQQQGSQSEGGRTQVPQMKQSQQDWQGSDRKTAVAPAAKPSVTQAHSRPGNGQGHSVDAAAGLPNGEAQLPEAGHAQQAASANMDVPPNVAPRQDRGVGREPRQMEGRHTDGAGETP